VNAFGLTEEVSIRRAEDQASVVWLGLMETPKVAPVERKNRPARGIRPIKHMRVGPTLICFADLARGHDIVSQPTEFLYDGERKAFVREQARHAQS